MLFDPRRWIKNSDNPGNVLLYFHLLAPPKGASNKILKTNIEMKRYFVPKTMKRYPLEKEDEKNFFAYIMTI